MPPQGFENSFDFDIFSPDNPPVMKALTQSGMREEVLDLYYRLDLSPFPIGDI